MTELFNSFFKLFAINLGLAPKRNDYLQPDRQKIRDRFDTKISPRSLLLLASLAITACDPNFDLASENKVVAKQALADPQQDTRYGRQAIFSYPEFSGPYQVGSHLIHLTDWSRVDPFDQQNIHFRELEVRFYYPKTTQEASQAAKQLSVIDQASWNFMIGHQTIEGKKLRYSNYRKAYWNIELDAKPHPQTTSFPLLVFSHGYGYNHNAYSALLGELASQGYLIAAINHSYGANPSYFASGKAVWAKSLPLEDPGRFIPLWSDDQRFVMDQLITMNQTTDSFFYQQLNTANIGIFGHSYGGAAAYYTAYQDARIKAIMDIDGSLFNAEQLSLEQPFAFLLSRYHQPKKIQANLSSNPQHIIRLLKFRHQSFTDHILWWQWDFDDDTLGYQQLDALRAVELTSQLVDSFFAQYLKNIPSKNFRSLGIKNQELEIKGFNLR